ncbi:MAG: hypothetical protein ACWGMZ_10365, partial [Thermoguttaceae bacterium]
GHGHSEEVVSRLIPPIATSTTVDNDYRAKGVLDASIGLQYDRALANGVDSFIRCTWEGQLWMDTGSPLESSGDMALEGLCLTLGITR